MAALEVARTVRVQAEEAEEAGGGVKAHFRGMA